MKFELKTYNRNISEQELLDDLKKVALKLGKEKITTLEYEENGKYSFGTYQKRFGNWSKALEKAELQIKVQRDISDLDLFENIEKVWLHLGRQPLYKELKRPLSKYSTRPYEKRFGSWLKALEAFVEYINIDGEQKVENEAYIFEKKPNTEIVFKHITKRQPSERLKVQVLMRDGNKCRLCGITVTGDNIHFDHIQPWSKGGETLLDNLQVLCEAHNLAKGNLEYDVK
ncbi:homing endonuclease associated repeat-containing protein [Runella aurantiaca]|uniref:HNH endonuclease n=1 Tax=Runella aurantiaca TaxID=2282308 RepID=A0A369IG06_9BACT|nr:HNH endonuclease [Runella aurantiaca]RDB07982.1 HNH endonuclease [Runella aurantiaca]